MTVVAVVWLLRPPAYACSKPPQRVYFRNLGELQCNIYAALFKSAPLPPAQIMQHRSPCCAFSINFLALAVLSCLLLGSTAVPLAGGSTPPGDEQLHPEFTLLKPRAPVPIPTPEQLRYQGSMNALVHFGMATFFHDGDPGLIRGLWF